MSNESCLCFRVPISKLNSYCASKCSVSVISSRHFQSSIILLLLQYFEDARSLRQLYRLIWITFFQFHYITAGTIPPISVTDSNCYRGRPERLTSEVAAHRRWVARGKRFLVSLSLHEHNYKYNLSKMWTEVGKLMLLHLLLMELRYTKGKPLNLRRGRFHGSPIGTQAT